MSAEGPLAGLQLLLVDDEEAVRNPLSRFLGRRGVAVREARDGEEALARIAEQEPDVILADLRMPRMGGVALFAALSRTHPALAERIIFLSGDVAEIADAGGPALPPGRVLTKPVELAQIEAALRRLVGQGGALGG